MKRLGKKDIGKLSFITMETENIAIDVCPEMGGELSSIRFKKLLNGKELLFRGNDYSDTDLPFTGRAPLMWPTVTRNYIKEVEQDVREGALPENSSYIYNDEIYFVPGRSGFAKELPWSNMASSAKSGICLELQSTTLTRKMYPFDFLLNVTHDIHDESTVTSTYTVYNKGDSTMFFSIGNHIGLNVPFHRTTNIEELLIRSSGLYKKGYNKHLMMTEEHFPVPLKDGMSVRDYPDLFIMTTIGYNYADNFFQVIDRDICYEIKQRVIEDTSRDYILPPPSEIYFTTWGGKEMGLICTEPWIGGVNSFNTGKGLIHLKPNGIFTWKLSISLRRTKKCRLPKFNLISRFS